MPANLSTIQVKNLNVDAALNAILDGDNLEQAEAGLQLLYKERAMLTQDRKQTLLRGTRVISAPTATETPHLVLRTTVRFHASILSFGRH